MLILFLLPMSLSQLLIPLYKYSDDSLKSLVSSNSLKGINIQDLGFAYMIQVTLGTPGQLTYLLVDTGSPLTIVNSVDCEVCTGMPTLFNLSNSESYSSIGVSNITSIDGSYWSFGNLSTDVLAVPDSAQYNSNIDFLLLTDRSSTEYSYIGSLGLGFSQQYTTWIDSLYKKGIITKRVFAMYLGSFNDTFNQGMLEVGSFDINKYTPKNRKKVVTQNIIKGSSFWYALIDKFVFMDYLLANVHVVYDSGYPFIGVDLNSFVNIFSYVNHHHSCLNIGMIVCECDSVSDMPGIEFKIAGQFFKVKSKEIWVSTGGVCVLLMSPVEREYWILGTPFLRNFYTVYDMDQMKITFASLESFGLFVSFFAGILLLS